MHIQEQPRALAERHTLAETHYLCEIRVALWTLQTVLVPVPLIPAFVAIHNVSVRWLLRLWRALRLVSLLLHVVGGEGAERKREKRSVCGESSRTGTRYDE